MSYYIADNGQQRGPFTPEQLPAQGLRADTLVWSEGMAGWERADRVPALAAVLPPPQQQQPPPNYNYASPGVPPGGNYAAPPGPMNYATPGGYATGSYPPAYRQSDANSKKIAAGICGILLGGLGIHKFILGYTTAGLVMLLVTVLTCGWGGVVMHVIGIVEGIIYLTKSDEQFYGEYVAQQRTWF